MFTVLSILHLYHATKTTDPDALGHSAPAFRVLVVPVPGIFICFKSDPTCPSK